MENILDSHLFGDSGEALEVNRFRHYKSYLHVEAARALTDLLTEHQVPFLAESAETIIDKAIVGNGLLPKVIVKLLPEDFTRVNALIEKEVEEADGFDIREHYLNDLNDVELRDILIKPDEWSIEDVTIAKLLLKDRGYSISEKEIQDLRADRLGEIRKGKQGSKLWLFLYFLAIILGLFLHFSLTIAGVGMGYYYAYGKNTDPDGRDYFIYEPETRKYGKVILFGGFVVLVLEIFLLINLG